MARPSKIVAVLQVERRSHRTKAELQRRSEAEQELMTGKKLSERREVKENPVAHREFQRVNRLLTTIGKNDALYEPIINRYCMLQAECADFENKRELFCTNLEGLMDEEKIEPATRYRLQAQMQKSILDVDKQIQTKRRMMFDIEKECAMTISAAARSIPKKPDAKENPLIAALRDGTDC